MIQVLCVGEAVGWLEVDLEHAGLSCVGVATATAAVEAMKQGLAQQQPWSAVVVSALLPDMTGPAFVDGLMRHFDPANVVLVADVEPHIAQHLTSSPKVRIFPAATSGNVVAEFLLRRLGGAHMPPHPPSPPSGASVGLIAGLFDAPGPPPPSPSFMSPSQLTATTSTPPTAHAGAWVRSNQPRSPTVTTMPFFTALGAQAPGPATLPHTTTSPSMSSPPSSSSSPPMATGADRAAQQRIEALSDELASANAEIAALRARAQTAEARAFDAAQKAFEREAQSAAVAAELGELQTELEIVRHAARAEVENGQQLLAEFESTRQALLVLQAEVEPLRAAVQERDQALEDARKIVEQVSAQHHADVASLNAHIVQLGEHLAAHEATATAHADELQALRVAMQDLEQGHAAELATQQAKHAQALEEIRDAARFELDGVRAMLAEATATAAEVEGLRARVAGLEVTAAEVEVLRAAKDEMESALGLELQQAHALQTRLAEAEARRADEQGRLASLQTEIERQKLRLDAAALAELEISTLAHARDGLIDRLNAAEARAAALADRLEAAPASATALEELRGRLEEAERYAAFESERAERAVADAAHLRQLLEASAQEKARVVAENEQLRMLSAEGDGSRDAPLDLQHQRKAALAADT
jgi:chromosome segregation ATPase